MTVWAMLASISQIILHPFYEPLLQAAALSAGQFDRYLLFTGTSSGSLSSPCAPSSSHTTHCALRHDFHSTIFLHLTGLQPGPRSHPSGSLCAMQLLLV
jgi:hypothetical protein